MRGRGGVSSHGGGKVPGAAGRPWIHSGGGVRVETVTSRHYHKTPILRGRRRGNQVSR